MESLIVSELTKRVMDGETPSNIVICVVVIYLAHTVRSMKTKMKEGFDDIRLIKNHLGITNVIDLKEVKNKKK